MWVACTPPCSLKCYLLVTHETFRNPSPHYMEINDTAVRKQSHRICPGPLFPYISINQFICAEKGLRAVKISPSPHFFAARIFPPLFFGLAFPFAWNLATATLYDTLPHCHTATLGLHTLSPTCLHFSQHCPQQRLSLYSHPVHPLALVDERKSLFFVDVFCIWLLMLQWSLFWRWHEECSLLFGIT